MTSNVSPVPFTTVAQSIPPNVFADMDRKVAAAVAGGADVIDLAKGNPDAFPADFIREVAKKGVDDPANARYSPVDGKPRPIAGQAVLTVALLCASARMRCACCAKCGSRTARTPRHSATALSAWPALARSVWVMPVTARAASKEHGYGARN